MGPIALIAGQIVLSAVFAVAAFSKLLAPSDFESALRSSGLKGPFVPWLTRGVPLVEVVLALGLVLSHGAALAGWSLAAAGLLVAFTGWLVAILRLPRRVPCGCFGSSRRVSGWSVARNFVLIVIGAAVAVTALEESSLPLKVDPASIVLVTTAMVGIGMLTAFKQVFPSLVLTVKKAEEREQGMGRSRGLEVGR